MKKLTVVLFLFVGIALFVMPIKTLAQFSNNSNTVTTRVGSPAGAIAACPIPNGTVTCGSEHVIVSGCGHCTQEYISIDPAQLSPLCTDPNYPGIHYAMDIGGNDFQNVILPSVEGKIINWAFLGQTNNIGNQAIQIYSGTEPSSGEKYRIQFHHTDPGSGGGNLSSGDIGAKICGNGCNMHHVHVEFAKVTSSGTEWVDAPSYFCK